VADDDDRPRKKRRDEEDEDRPRRRRDEEEEDRPRRRRDEDEEDDRPRRRRDEDEEEDRPRRWRRYEAEDDDYDDRGSGRRQLSREALRGIAGSQKGIIVCILISLCLVPAFAIMPEGSQMFLLIVLVPVNIAATVFVFLLATKVYSPAMGVFCGILTLVPCIGLGVLIMINQKAVGILKQNGVRVGFLGANASEI
jgi:hypothetical protein